MGLFRALNNGQTAEECLKTYSINKQKSELDRRSKFEMFGIPVGCACPATKVYHLQSRIFHDTVLPLSPKEVHLLTTNLEYKRYPGAARVSLPSELPPLELSLERAILDRRSIRSFSAAPISIFEFAKLLHLCCGISELGVVPRRAAPSPGALYAVETYALALRVEEVVCGLYHYDALNHQLEQLGSICGPEDLWPALGEGFRGIDPAVAIIHSARLSRIQAKYGERGYRFVLMESGHIVQNLLLVAVALGLAAVPIGGFVDEELNRIVGVDGEEEVCLYVTLLGRSTPKVPEIPQLES